MDKKSWDSINKTERGELLKKGGLPTGLSQLSWAGLQKSERAKLEKAMKSKGSGWYEDKENVHTEKGIEKKAPIHREVAIKKEAEQALNKPMERKEPIVAQEWTLNEKREVEHIGAEFNKLNLRRGNVLYSKHSGAPYKYIGSKNYSTDKGIFGLAKHYTKYKFESKGGIEKELFKEQVLELLSKTPIKEAGTALNIAMEGKPAHEELPQQLKSEAEKPGMNKLPWDYNGWWLKTREQVLKEGVEFFESHYFKLDDSYITVIRFNRKGAAYEVNEQSYKPGEFTAMWRAGKFKMDNGMELIRTARTDLYNRGAHKHTIEMALKTGRGIPEKVLKQFPDVVESVKSEEEYQLNYLAEHPEVAVAMASTDPTWGSKKAIEAAKRVLESRKEKTISEVNRDDEWEWSEQEKKTESYRVWDDDTNEMLSGTATYKTAKKIMKLLLDKKPEKNLSIRHL